MNVNVWRECVYVQRLESAPHVCECKKSISERESDSKRAGGFNLKEAY